MSDVKILQASHTGDLKIGDMHFQVAVLDDEDSTRVVSETQFMKQMGMYRSGALSVRRREDVEEGSAPQILSLAYKNLKPFVDMHLGGVHFRPLTYRTVKGNVATAGLRADIIPKVCEVWIDADRADVLGPRQKLIAAKADKLLRGFAHVGIIALIDEATGFQEVRDRRALNAILDKYLRDEKLAWAKRFPDEFYQEMFRLRGWQWRGMRVNRPSIVGHYTNDLVYDRLIPGVMEKLRKQLDTLNPRDEHGQRKAKHHQWLTEELGVPELGAHLTAIMALMRASTSWDQFNRMVQRAFPKKNTTMLLPIPDDVTS